MTTRSIFFLALLCALSLVVYIIFSHFTYRVGFPLDDAWIYQTYARNLILNREWAFQSGVPSAGSTGPLWTFLVAIGYLVSIETYYWAYFLGWMGLWGLSILGVFAFRTMRPQRDIWILGGGILIAFEWHLVWAAGSGMETLLFALLCTLVLVLLVIGNKEKKNGSGLFNYWLVMGILIGISTWIRPSGVTLIGPASFVLLVSEYPRQEKIKKIQYLILGFASIFGVYLTFNHSVSGTWLPNTFHAKQIEYAILREKPFWDRIASQFILPLTGVGVLLLPGFIRYGVIALRERLWGVIAGILWILGYIFIYTWLLPVTYQHGRYIIPVMPTFFLWGSFGLFSWIEPKSTITHRRIISRTWLIATFLVLLIFWVKGADTYGKDVAVIESEMVATAKWVSVHTPMDSLVAAHDIGALGYFGNRRLVDLAGLISPEVIPIIRNEDKLENYLDTKMADYLITFPNWYPNLVSKAKLIYQTNGKFSPALGGENMAVYAWSFR